MSCDSDRQKAGECTLCRRWQSSCATTYSTNARGAMLDLSDGDIERIFYHNAVELLGLATQGSR